MRRRVLVSGLFVFATVGCQVDGLAFRQDHRLEIVTPSHRSDVQVPVEIRWDVRRTLPDSVTQFALLIDQAAPSPGDELRSILPDEFEGCVDDCARQALQDRGVYVTDETAITVEHVRRRTGERGRSADRHEIVVILLDQDGRRVDETAATVDIYVEAP